MKRPLTILLALVAAAVLAASCAAGQSTQLTALGSTADEEIGGPAGVTAATAVAQTASGSTAPATAPSTTRPGPSTSQPALPLTATLPSLTTPTTLPRALPADAPTMEIPILMYHFVDDAPPPAGRWAAGLTVATKDFESQMDYLASHGFHPVTLQDVYAAMGGMRTLPDKPVVLTFDDGNKDNFTVAFPILRAHGFCATFFVVTGFVGNDLSMSWDDLRTMKEAGMAIESHTYDHKDLRRVDAVTRERELVGSREEIAAQIGVSPVVLCYPAGAYNEKILTAAEAAGYLMAVTTKPGKKLDPLSRYEWPRVRVSPGEGIENFISKLK